MLQCCFIKEEENKREYKSNNNYPHIAVVIWVNRAGHISIEERQTAAQTG